MTLNKPLRLNKICVVFYMVFYMVWALPGLWLAFGCGPIWAVSAEDEDCNSLLNPNSTIARILGDQNTLTEFLMSLRGFSGPVSLILPKEALSSSAREVVEALETTLSDEQTYHFARQGVLDYIYQKQTEGVLGALQLIYEDDGREGRGGQAEIEGANGSHFAYFIEPLKARRIQVKVARVFRNKDQTWNLSELSNFDRSGQSFKPVFVFGQGHFLLDQMESAEVKKLLSSRSSTEQPGILKRIGALLLQRDLFRSGEKVFILDPRRDVSLNSLQFINSGVQDRLESMGVAEILPFDWTSVKSAIEGALAPFSSTNESLSLIDSANAFGIGRLQLFAINNYLDDSKVNADLLRFALGGSPNSNHHISFIFFRLVRFHVRSLEGLIREMTQYFRLCYRSIYSSSTSSSRLSDAQLETLVRLKVAAFLPRFLNFPILEKQNDLNRAFPITENLLRDPSFRHAFSEQFDSKGELIQAEQSILEDRGSR